MVALIGPLGVDRIAQGGQCIARHDGRVVFVRHAIPGETVMVRITDSSKGKFWRGDAVEIIEPSPHRVAPPCPIAGICGGCDFQHVDLGEQRRLKANVLAEQLSRLAGLDWRVEVEAVPGETGFGWRSRMRYQMVDGVVGLAGHRSSEMIPLPAGGCLIAAERGREILRKLPRDCGELVVATGEQVSQLCASETPEIMRQQVGDSQFKVWSNGFWQPHLAAPELLTEVVLEFAAPKAGERALDLFCGVGLFAKALADAQVQVHGVEVNRRAIELARQNVPGAEFSAGKVDSILPRMHNQDLVVLDPPRSGVGRRGVELIAGLHPERVVYVSCDPASLARDISYFARQGFKLAKLRAFDLFPMTHHFESVALLTRA